MEINGKINGHTLKIIAAVTMLIDHTAAAIFIRMIRMQWGFVNADNYEVMRMIYLGMRAVGRLAFPIFCFLLVEGFIHTSNKIKYAIRLFVFALLSEIPFDFALRGALFDSSYNNVIITLFLGFVAMALIDPILKHMDQVSDSKTFTILWFLLKAGIVAAIGGGIGAIAEYVLKTDYGFWGVAAIVAMYVLRSQPEIEMLAGVLVLLGAGKMEAFAIFDVLLIRYYNGERGEQKKYFFYAFYPLHLLILGVIAYQLGLM